MTMTAERQARSAPLLAVTGVASVAWAVGVTLVATQADTDPAGQHYDAANRALTIALVGLLVSAWLVWRTRRGRSLAFVTVGLLLALLGNVLEFWVLWVTGGVTDASAARTGEDGAALSSIGFGVFLIGMLLVLGGSVGRAVSVASSRRERVAWVGAGLLLTASTGVWAVAPALASVVAAAAAACWWLAVIAEG